MAVSENAVGFTAVRLHYTADPAKDPLNAEAALAAEAQRWLELQRRIFPDPNDFEREYEINFFVGKGQRVFPQFSQTYHTTSYVPNRYRVVYRGWDFGWHCPVCLLAQVDTAGRLVIFREILQRNCTTHDFAQRVIAQCAELFPNHSAGFEDFCDPAGQQVRSIESERNERRDIEVLSGLGINPKFEYGWSRKDGRTLVHRLLSLRSDGTAGLLLNEADCPSLVQAFLGRYVFPERRNGTFSDEPDDDTHPWADLMAATRYMATGLHRKLGLSTIQFASEIPAPAGVDYHGYGTPRR